ncbi:MAG: YceI family protein [Pseudomonadota bacterium]
MHRLPALLLALLLIAPLTAPAALAQAVSYALDRETSLVGFAFDLTGGSEIKGNMPVAAAEIALDVDTLEQSRAVVTLDTRRAITEQAFATDAMLGPNVLAAEDFPTIRFEATRITGNVNAARVEGRVTIKGITRPITLDAQVFRQRGTEAGDLSRLSVFMTGRVDRRDFGADGFPQFVGPEIRIEILTRLTRS